eukprot:7255694-Pyramimonas_sp.AAC.1
MWLGDPGASEGILDFVFLTWCKSKACWWVQGYSLARAAYTQRPDCEEFAGIPGGFTRGSACFLELQRGGRELRGAPRRFDDVIAPR